MAAKDTTALDVSVETDVSQILAVAETYVAALHVDGDVTLFDAVTGASVFTLTDIRAVTAAYVRATGELWIGRRQGLGLLLISVQHPDTQRTCEAHNEVVTLISAVGSTQVVTQGTDGNMILWSVEGHIISRATLELPFIGCTVGQSLWYTTEAELCVVPIDENSQRSTFALPRAASPHGSTLATCICWSSASDTVWVGFESGSIHVFDAWSYAHLSELMGAPEATPITALAVEVLTAETVWSSSSDGTLTEWDSKRLLRRRSVRIHGAESVSTMCTVVQRDPVRESFWLGGMKGRLCALFSSPASPDTRGETDALLARIEALETDLLRAQEVSVVLDGKSTHREPDVQTLQLQLECYERRIEELEHSLQNASATRPDSVGNVDSVSDAGSADAHALQLMEGKLTAAFQDIDQLRTSVDDYKAIAKEATIAADEAQAETARLTAAVKVHERETEDVLRRSSQLESQLLSARARLAAMEVACTAAEECIEEHTTTLRAVQADYVTEIGRGSQHRERWSATELAAVEGVLQENDSLNLQLRLMEQLVATQHKRVPQDNNVPSSAILTQCFLVLRRELSPQLANQVILDALGGEVNDEMQAITRILSSLSQRLS